MFEKELINETFQLKLSVTAFQKEGGMLFQSCIIVILKPTSKMSVHGHI